MKSIRASLFSFSLLLITVLMIPLSFFILIHFQIVAEYRKSIQRIVAEQQIPQQTNEIILNYYHYAQDIQSSEKKLAYDHSISQMQQTLQNLDLQITDKESLLRYQSLKNIVATIKKQLDASILQAQNGNILEISTTYEQENHENNFVQTITSDLLSAELNYLRDFQNQLQKTDFVVLTIGFVILAITLAVAMIFSRIFSNRIVTPITKLSIMSQKIAEGNLDLNIDPKLLDKQDETGMLAKSFQTMIDNLKNKIKLLQQSESNILKANQELETINKFTIGREIRMTELKKQVEDLEKKLALQTKT